MKIEISYPYIAAVIAMRESLLPAANELYRDKYKLEPSELVKFVQDTQNSHLVRLDDPEAPFLKRNDQGIETLVMMWGHPKNPLDPHFQIAIICPLTKDKRGLPTYKPESVVRGPKANVMIAGFPTCCEGAVQAHWTEIKGNEWKEESRIPYAGMPNPEYAHWFKGKVALAHTPADMTLLKEMGMDILARRFPNDPRFQAPGQSSLPSFKEVARLTMGL